MNSKSILVTATFLSWSVTLFSLNVCAVDVCQDLLEPMGNSYPVQVFDEAVEARVWQAMSADKSATAKQPILIGGNWGASAAVRQIAEKHRSLALPYVYIGRLGKPIKPFQTPPDEVTEPQIIENITWSTNIPAIENWLNGVKAGFAIADLVARPNIIYNQIAEQMLEQLQAEALRSSDSLPEHLTLLFDNPNPSPSLLRKSLTLRERKQAGTDNLPRISLLATMESEHYRNVFSGQRLVGFFEIVPLRFTSPWKDK